MPSLRPILIFSFAVATAGAADMPENITFNEHIRPILADNCFACHGADAGHRKAKLRLDQGAEALASREGIRAFAAGDLAESEAWQRILSDDPEEVMPPPDSHKLPLKPEQRALIKRWIEQGAVYQNHWAYEPVTRPDLPKAAGGAKSQDAAIDRFIGAKLADKKLKLAPEASREVLLRRLTLDLTGLPPMPQELDAFLKDRAPDAYDRVVTRLLASPRFGEHFARYWLDLVRYADTHGLHLDNVRNLWPYRDWVVSAFNRNLSYDQFTLEQLAGDLLPHPRIDQLVATGYNRSHLTTSEGGAIEAEAEARNTGDRADTTAAVWLGLTANCASCHDHKFDPLTQREYYELGAFFKGLADRCWDGNIPKPGPIVLLANTEQQARIEAIARELPPLQAALSARAQMLPMTLPAPVAEAEKPATPSNPSADKPEKKSEALPITYEVIWAEDGDMPVAANFGAPAPIGEWRSGPAVPLFGGQRALRLEGAVNERIFTFATGETPLVVNQQVVAFVHFNADPARPPRAVSLEFVSDEKTKRYVWGNLAALRPSADGDVVVGPLPPAGTYARLEIPALAAGLASKKAYRGLRLTQSDGAAWWDHAGTTCTSAKALDDPLLTKSAWVRFMQSNARDVTTVPLPNDIVFLLGLSSTQQNDAEKKRLEDYYRDYIYGPTRGVLEPEVHAVRRLLAEQVHYELTLDASLIARELPEPHPAHILIRGQYDKLGERVLPATPAFLPPLHAQGPRASRLDLARWIVDPKNPLPSRVAVNRFWQQLLGAGLVGTPGDFGAQGDPPTHPALLDWLASEFMTSGWDVKHLVRLIVTSRTYRQDSRVDPALLELDPTNKLLARGPRLRLDGEVLRDQALAVSGLLRPEIGGAPVRPYQPINIWEPVAFGGSNTKTYVQDHGNALYRRSLYTFWKRTAPAPAISTFDAPSRENLCVGRGRSNTPLQALALMNDVQHFEAARAFAERLLAQPGDDDERLALAFRSVTARFPDLIERALLTEALATHRTHFSADTTSAAKILTNGETKAIAAQPAPEIAAWTLVANLILNLDEAVTRN
ncbi:MAG: PSD1 and planctomycete cytochrome C domain-containing protein [Opitutaceae bacterium]